jgi:hypothetical protein
MEIALMVKNSLSIASAAMSIGCLTIVADAQEVSVNEQVASVVSHLVGVMDTSAQATANPKAPSVRMTTCKIQVEDSLNSNSASPSVYLYQEQALTEKLNQPYRQRFLQIQPSRDRETVESKSFKPQRSESVVGLCNKPKEERTVKLSELGESVCSVFLKPTQTGFVGETPSQGCPAKVRGAVKITNRIVLRPEGMDTWDRGYDVNGNQVWGAQDNSYQFRWIRQGD